VEVTATMFEVKIQILQYQYAKLTSDAGFLLKRNALKKLVKVRPARPFFGIHPRHQKAESHCRS
jgi:hypothetical protein